MKGSINRIQKKALVTEGAEARRGRGSGRDPRRTGPLKAASATSLPVPFLFILLSIL